MSADAPDDGGADDDGADGERTPRETMEAALGAVRREGLKAALVYAILDATAVFLAANLALTVLAPPWVPFPAAIAGGVGVAAFAAELWLRTRRSLVERFEAVNPEVAGPLRTARDATADGADTRMAARLYEEVIDRLRDTSGVALVDARRVAATGLVVVLLSLATLQVTVVGLSAFGPDDADPSVDDEPGGALAPEGTSLRDGSEVLGDPDSVDRGDDNRTAQVEADEGSGPVDTDRSFPSEGGADGDFDVESRQAGFDDPERIEDAELVREYNLRIREDE